MKNKILTAEEYALEHMQGTDLQEIESVLVGFAQMHIQHLLDNMLQLDLLHFTKKVDKFTGILWQTYDNFPLQNLELNKDYISKLYPLENIK